MTALPSHATAEEMLGQYANMIAARISLTETALEPMYFQIKDEISQLQLLAIADENRELKRLAKAIAKVSKSLRIPTMPPTHSALIAPTIPS